MLGPIGIYTNATIREKIREKYGIDGKEANKCADGLVGDILMMCCCGICSLVQEAQELKIRGDAAPDGIKVEPVTVSIDRQ